MMNIVIVGKICAELVPFSHPSNLYWSGATSAANQKFNGMYDVNKDIWDVSNKLDT